MAKQTEMTIPQGGGKVNNLYSMPDKLKEQLSSPLFGLIVAIFLFTGGSALTILGLIDFNIGLCLLFITWAGAQLFLWKLECGLKPLGRIAVLLLTTGIICLALKTPLEVRYKKQKQKIHIVKTEVAFSHDNPNLLFAKICLQNDGDDVVVEDTHMTSLADTPAPQDRKWQGDAIRNMKEDIPANGGETYHLTPHQQIWMTDSADLTDEEKAKFLKGEYTFYFMGAIRIKSARGELRPLDYCGFVTGNNLNVVSQCPN